MKTRCWLGLMLVCAVSASAEVVPSTFNYQGVLRGGAGQLLGPVVKSVTFRLYKEPTQGTVVWGRTCAVLLDSNGLFNVELSDGNGSKLTTPAAAVDAALTNVLSSSSSLYLGVTVENANEIAPRQQLLSVPFAMMAGNVKQTGNLNVNGTLTVANGMVVGPGLTLVNADGTHSPKIEVSRTGQIAIPADLQVSGGVFVAGTEILNGDLSVGGAAVVDGNVQFEGTFLLRGATRMLSTNQINKCEIWTTAPSTPAIIMGGAMGDGLIIINVSLSMDTQYAGDEGSCKFEISFSGRPNNTRSVEKTLYINNADTKSYTVTDVITLPYLDGESVSISSTITGARKDYHSVKYKYYCVPFGLDNK